MRIFSIGLLFYFLASKEHFTFDVNGNVLHYFGNRFRPNHTADALRGNIRIPRERLRKLLLQQLPPDAIRWGMNIQSITPDTAGVSLVFSPISSTFVPTNLDSSSIPTAEIGPVERGVEIKVAIPMVSDKINPNVRPLITNIHAHHAIPELASTKSAFRPAIPQTDNFTNPSTPVVFRACMVVGADGIHSRVRAAMGPSSLSYLGVCLIIGVSQLRHPLLNERGFYTVDGKQRLFTMPFAVDGDGILEGFDSSNGGAKKNDSSISPINGNRISDDTQICTPDLYPGSIPHTGVNSCNDSSYIGRTRLTMWQFSFWIETEAEARDICSGSPDVLLQTALRRTRGWHAPVNALLRNTIGTETWATPLYDFGESADFSAWPPGKKPNRPFVPPGTSTSARGSDNEASEIDSSKCVSVPLNQFASTRVYTVSEGEMIRKATPIQEPTKPPCILTVPVCKIAPCVLDNSISTTISHTGIDYIAERNIEKEKCKFIRSLL